MFITEALRESFRESGWNYVQLAFHADVSVSTARTWIIEGVLPRADAYEALRAKLPGLKQRLDDRAVA